MNPENWYDMINTNLNGAFEVVHHIVSNLINKKCGSIVFIFSITTIKGMIGQTNLFV